MPVDVLRGPQGSRLRRDAALVQADNGNPSVGHCREVAIAGQQNALLGSATGEQYGIGHAALGNHRVIAGCTKPTPEPDQHFVA